MARAADVVVQAISDPPPPRVATSAAVQESSFDYVGSAKVRVALQSFVGGVKGVVGIVVNKQGPGNGMFHFRLSVFGGIGLCLQHRTSIR